MTDALAPITLPALGPGPEYKSLAVWLPQLFMETVRAGSRTIEGRTFVDCLIEGPAVLLAVEGCHFDDCNLGDADGDPRTLMLAPQAPRQVVGPIPFRNCRFIGCQFLGVGFTGSPEFLASMTQALTSPQTEAGQ
ncbi:hypothetical protein ABE444_11500 [Brevundimonas pondensis]|jgi:hypothetical protein|uniref:PilZ domain-containing protein n=1 Tax=Brevundimonas pondensis TaxID=2774189 RepID=A0ABX7SKB0_9CAUL|nr:hypothetical protein [Brevundimonas pondensis]QTC87794.1 hypothetical protein IFE19_17270 [Brevundimonas pondensis]